MRLARSQLSLVLLSLPSFTLLSCTFGTHLLWSLASEVYELYSMPKLWCVVTKPGLGGQALLQHCSYGSDALRRPK